MYSSGTKSGYYYSLTLHICCALALFVFGFVAELFRTQEEPPVVFEIVEPIPEAPSNTSEAPKEPDTEEIIQPQLDPIKPLELPEPEPEPEPEPKPEPVPQPEPEPKPEKKIEKPPVPQKVSYADFIKQNPKKGGTQLLTGNKKSSMTKSPPIPEASTISTPA